MEMNTFSMSERVESAGQNSDADMDKRVDQIDTGSYTKAYGMDEAPVEAARVEADEVTPTEPPESIEGVTIVRRGRGADNIDGTEGDDTIRSGGGNDVVNGGGGADIIFGGRGHDELNGGADNDKLYGGRGRDEISGGEGNDLLVGGGGRDVLSSQFGNDVLKGGRGNDTLISRSDSGEPIIAQDPELPRYYSDNPIQDANDVMTGGKGADKFFFRLDIDAKLEIAQKHADADGVIDWRAVAGENDNAHDHWVNGIGNDVITDFNQSQGDTIVIEGHTTQAAVEHIDLDDDGTMESTRITLYSDQGNNGGAHQDDSLGTIMVEGVLLTDGDISRTANVFHGAHETVDDLILA